MVDDHIRRRGLDAPPAEPNATDGPVELDPPTALDLRRRASAAWCVVHRFGGDFSFLDPPCSTPTGNPGARTPPRPRPASSTSGCSG